MRLKKYLEIRGADATPSPLALAVPTIWKGLLYDMQALADAVTLARAIPSSDILSLSNLAARDGLRGEYGGRTIAAWCGDAVSIAAKGLSRIAIAGGCVDESCYLDPMREVLASGRSPGDLWPEPGTVAEVLKRCEYP